MSADNRGENPEKPKGYAAEDLAIAKGILELTGMEIDLLFGESACLPIRRSAGPHGKALTMEELRDIRREGTCSNTIGVLLHESGRTEYGKEK